MKMREKRLYMVPFAAFTLLVGVLLALGPHEARAAKGQNDADEVSLVHGVTDVDVNNEDPISLDLEMKQVRDGLGRMLKNDANVTRFFGLKTGLMNRDRIAGSVLMHQQLMGDVDKTELGDVEDDKEAVEEADKIDDKLAEAEQEADDEAEDEELDEDFKELNDQELFRAGLLMRLLHEDLEKMLEEKAGRLNDSGKRGINKDLVAGSLAAHEQLLGKFDEMGLEDEEDILDAKEAVADAQEDLMDAEAEADAEKIEDAKEVLTEAEEELAEEIADAAAEAEEEAEVDQVNVEQIGEGKV